MRILIATPLYPPEVAPAAAYAKELARRLSEQHQVMVLAYAHLPEALADVRMISIEKRQPRLARLRAFRRALVREARETDAIIAINGASVELPLIVARGPFVLCIADAAAHAHAGLLERAASARARAVIREIPPPKPEILPLEARPEAALAAWERVWSAHLETLVNTLNHAR
jgi:hypothetical protein